MPTSINVLIFEDEAIVALDIKTTLMNISEYNLVIVVKNFEEFKAALAKTRFDIVYLDINIKGEPIGIEAGAYLRSNYNTGLIYITAYSNEGIVEQLAQNIPDAYLTKPFEDFHLLNITKQVIYKYSNNNSLGQIAISQQQGKYLSSRIEFHQELIDQIYIVSITDAFGKIIYANDGLCAISGFDRTELISKTHAVINSGFHSSEFFADLWHTIKAGKVWHGQVRNKKKNGEFFWTESYVFPLHSDQINSEKYFICIGHDISQQKAMEEKLDFLLQQKDHHLVNIQNQFNRMSKDNSMVGFNSVFIHELKRPLATISMQAELILNQYVNEIPEKAQSKLIKFRESTNHILKLINYLHEAFTRKQTDKKEKLDIVAQVQSIIDFTRLLFPIRTPDINFSSSAPLIFVLGYNDSIFLPVFNCLKNSCEAFAEDQEDRKIHIQICVADNMTNILIEDNKIGGIPEKFVKNLFRSDFVSDKCGGSGLGLKISRQCLKMMDGNIELVKTGAEGSCFKISLPVVAIS